MGLSTFLYFCFIFFVSDILWIWKIQDSDVQMNDTESIVWFPSDGGVYLTSTAQVLAPDINVMLGTATPTHADAGLNMDDKGYNTLIILVEMYTMKFLITKSCPFHIHPP